jgi:hypothetical protein
MARSVTVEVELPGDLRRYRFPKALDRRLTALLDKQDRGEKLTVAERKEAEGLVHVAEVYSFLRLRVERARSGGAIRHARIAVR